MDDCFGVGMEDDEVENEEGECCEASDCERNKDTKQNG